MKPEQITEYYQQRLLSKKEFDKKTKEATAESVFAVCPTCREVALKEDIDDLGECLECSHIRDDLVGQEG